MPGMFYAKNPVKSNVGPDLLDPTILAYSMNTQALAPYEGDPMVWTTATGSQARQRKLTATDITNLYASGGNIIGVLGLAPASVGTDAAGAFQAPPVGTSILANVANRYNIPSMDGYAPQDPVTGATMASTISGNNFWGGSLWETTAVNESLVGTMVGILISTLSGQAPTFFWSTAATTKIARIVGVYTGMPLFNTTGVANVQDTTHSPRSPLYVRLLGTYDQFKTAFNYSN